MIALNRKQLKKLSKLVEHFTEVEWFTVEQNGLGMQVKFNLFGDEKKRNEQK